MWDVQYAAVGIHKAMCCDIWLSGREGEGTIKTRLESITYLDSEIAVHPSSRICEIALRAYNFVVEKYYY